MHCLLYHKREAESHSKLNPIKMEKLFQVDVMISLNLEVESIEEALPAKGDVK